jgi:hypothetical protein
MWKISSASATVIGFKSRCSVWIVVRNFKSSDMLKEYEWTKFSEGSNQEIRWISFTLIAVR